jgi:6,7-dimethyl-8-ribityllumazine synthase
MQLAGRGPVTADGAGLRVGLVRASFNRTITQALEQACREQLERLGVAAGHVHAVEVPGALEVPLALQALARRGGFDALVALGCVIRGETHHFELVANESGAGVTRVALDHHLPIANAILTVETEAQAWARVAEKGRDAADVAVAMARLLAAQKAAA